MQLRRKTIHFSKMIQEMSISVHSSRLPRENSLFHMLYGPKSMHSSEIAREMSIFCNDGKQ